MEKLMKIGYGRANITPDELLNLTGYGNDEVRIAKEIRDKLYATCIAFTDTEGNTGIMCTTDALNTYAGIVAPIRKAIAEEFDIPYENIHIAATHSHSTPAIYLGNPEMSRYRDKFKTGIIEAARRAMNDRAPAILYVSGTPTERMNFVRHMKMADGTYAGSNFGDWSSGIVGHTSNNDSWIQVIKIDRVGKKSIILMNWQAHPCFTGGIGKYVLSADYISDVRKYVEMKTGARFAFFQGAAGNHNGVSTKVCEHKTDDSAEYGRLLGDYVLRALESTVQVKGGKVQGIRRDLELELDHTDDHLVPKAKEIWSEWVKTYDRPACNKRAMEELGQNSIYAVSHILARAERPATDVMSLYALKVGDLAFACAPYEMFGESGMHIKEYSPYAMTFVVSCCNDSKSYLATKLAFGHGCYEVDSRWYPMGTAEKLADNFVEMLKEIK